MGGEHRPDPEHTQKIANFPDRDLAGRLYGVAMHQRAVAMGDSNLGLGGTSTRAAATAYAYEHGLLGPSA
mgnify:CR=1 FL=1